MPQPWDGRCWKSPSESRSPCSTLTSFDSCIAVATAIVAARSGSPRFTEIATIVAAFSACAALSWVSVAPTLTVQVADPTGIRPPGMTATRTLAPTRTTPRAIVPLRMITPASRTLRTRSA